MQASSNSRCRNIQHSCLSIATTREKGDFSAAVFIVFRVATQCPAMMTKHPNGLLVIATIGRQQFLSRNPHRQQEKRIEKRTKSNLKRGFAWVKSCHLGPPTCRSVHTRRKDLQSNGRRFGRHFRTDRTALQDICVAIAEIIPKDQEQQTPPLMPEQHFCPALKQ